MSNRRRPAVPPVRRATSAPRPAAGKEQPGSVRGRLAGGSKPALIYLTALPRWVPALGTAVLLLAGLAVPGPIGAACLLLVGAFLGWLLTLSWPLLRGPARLLRVLTVALVLGFAGYQLTR